MLCIIQNMPYVINEIDGDLVECDIIEDTREQKNAFFVKRLHEIAKIEKIKIVRHPLKSGDYFINRGRGLNIEMKSVTDLIGSYTGKNYKHGSRLDNELSGMNNPTLRSRILSDLANKIINEMNPDDYSVDISSQFIEDILDFVGAYDSVSSCLIIRGGLSVNIDYDINIETRQKEKRGKLVNEHYTDHLYHFKYKDDKGKYRTSNLHPNSWYSIKRKIQHFVPVIETSSVDSTISWMISQVKAQKRIEAKLKKGVDPTIGILRSVRKNATDREIVHGIVQGFLGVGDVNSQAIFKNYSSLRDFFLNVKTIYDLKNCGFNDPTAKNTLRLMDYHPIN